jgi:lysophospholipase L1-like esterase
MSTAGKLVLKPNDRIVFLGDSITEQKLYTTYVEEYLAARYPELSLTFFNAGWGGDTAPGGLKRLDRDVLALCPTLVCICYGMNDGRYTEPTDEILSTFLGGMKALVARLKEAGARVVLLTPGMVDDRVAPHLAPPQYNRRGLRVLADAVLKLARAEKLPAGDIHKLMNEVDEKARAADPKFTMVPDGVHPDPAGHLVMAYGLLQALGVPPRRQEIVLDAAAGKATAGKGVRLSGFESTVHGVSAQIELDRLPFFVELDARKVLPFLPFEETFNSLTLKVRGLDGSNAYFRTPTARTAARPRGDFEAGINLFSQWNVGPMLQAEAVHRFTVEKQAIYFKLWRALGVFERIDYVGEAPAFRAAIELVPTLDRARDQMLGEEARRFVLHLAATDKAGESVQNGEFIGQWAVMGPFPQPFDQDALGGEAAFSAKAAPLAAGWQPVELDLAAPGNNLTAVFGPHDRCFAYAATVLDSPVDQGAELLLGSDDGIGAWLNGQAVLSNLSVARAVGPDQERVKVRLRAGRNVLLVKVTQFSGNWGFCARFAGLQKSLVATAPTAQAAKT